MIIFIVVLAIGLVFAFVLIKSVDSKHTENNVKLKADIEKNQEAIKDTTKEILGYDPFDISIKGGKRAE